MGGGGGGGQGRCERRSDVFVKIQKKVGGGGYRLRGGGGGQDRCLREVKFLCKKKMGGGSQGLCERRIAVFVKIQKKKRGWGGGWGGRVGGVRVDVNQRSEVLMKIIWGWGGGGGVRRGVGGGGGRERRIEVFVKIQKKKNRGVGGRVGGLEGLGACGGSG